jgi:putative CocE/NonD family hydrolase
MTSTKNPPADSPETGALGIVTETDVMVTMRDGTQLACTLFRPDAPGTYPGLLLRTPYRKPESGYERYVRAGFAVVTQDSRGRYASEGDWVPFTVEDTGDAEDGFDSVEWLAQQPWCNGRIGTLGASYNAWMQWQLAKLKPPHLQAMCAYTIPRELTAVDWPGGFRPGRRIKWWLTSMAPDLRRRAGWPPPHTPEQARAMWDEGIEGEGHWIGTMPWIDVCRHLPPGLASYARDWLKHPSRRAWKMDEIHHMVDVPNLDFSGWYDH